MNNIATEGAGMPHFEQLNQMINHLMFLSDALVTKAGKQDTELSELKSTTTESNEKIIMFE